MRIQKGFRLSASIAMSCLLLSGCAHFDDRVVGQTFSPTPALTPKAGGEPQLPGEDGLSSEKQGGASSNSPQPPQGCQDFDKAVVETCLDTVTSVIALPGSDTQPTALAGERKTGRILKVSPNTDPTEVARVPVDAAGDGGLTAIALSPSYDEDRLIFAYVTTASDNRVVRIAAGEQPKPILTGLPKGASGNRGALLPDGKGALLVATGDGEKSADAANGNSLAGKVLRIDIAGKPADGNPTPGSAILASGLHNPGGLCRSSDNARLWVTDRTPSQDALYKVQAGASLASPIWTWPDKPGLAGCVDNDNAVLIAASTAGNLQNLPITPEGMAGGTPSSLMDGKTGTSYGRLAGVDPINADFMFVGTVNKDGGKPVSSDDRVVIMPRKPAGSGSAGKD